MNKYIIDSVNELSIICDSQSNYSFISLVIVYALYLFKLGATFVSVRWLFS